MTNIKEAITRLWAHVVAYGNSILNQAKEYTDSKEVEINGAASTVVDSNLTASRVLVSDSNGKIAASSSITTTELGYLDGTTSAIQTQLNGKVPTSRTINGKALTGNIALSAADVGAATTAQGTKADSAVQLVSTGSANGTIAVDGTNVAVAGLADAAYVSVDSIIESVKAQIGYTVVSDTAPTITNNNIIWVSTSDSLARYYNGTDWVALGAVWK